MTRWRTGRDSFSTARCFDAELAPSRAIWEDARNIRNRQGRRECLSRGDRCWRERRRHWRPCRRSAQEANWPQRPLRIIIPTAPGGSPDIASRLHRRQDHRAAWPVDRGGEHDHRRRRCRPAARREVGAGRLYAGDADRRLCDPGRGAEEPAIRAAQGFRLHHLGGALSDGLFGAAGFADQELQGHDRARQGRSRQGQLRHRRRRQRLSSARQVDRQCRGRRDERGAVSRHGARAAGCARRAGRRAERCRDQQAFRAC